MEMKSEETESCVLRFHCSLSLLWFRPYSCVSVSIRGQRFWPLLRFALGHSQEHFFQPEFILPQSGELDAVLDQQLRKDARLHFMVLKSNFDLAIDRHRFGHFRPGTEQLNGAGRI